MRTIADAQFRFQAQRSVDVDGDGASEYGWLAELGATTPLRGLSETLSPPLLSGGVGAVDPNGRMTKHGYLFAVYLPDASGVGLAETAANRPNADPNLARDYWTCVAWPVSRASGRRAFFVNQQGQLLQTASGYAGTTAAPQAGCALVGVPPDRIDSALLAIGAPGADGNTWIAVQ